MNRLVDFLYHPASAFTLAYFRMGLGALILCSTLRFIALGWIDMQYVQPQFHFPYFGLEFFSTPTISVLYATFTALIISSICVILGYRFRVMSIIMFLSFTYVELWDISFYLNHYYAVSLFSFMLCFLPAATIASFDVHARRVKQNIFVPYWTHVLLLFQISIIYVYAGIAKINSDWLLQALPLKIWLPAQSSLPLIGPLFSFEYTPYLFSWAGMLFDLFIIIFLIMKKTRLFAFASVIIFHSLTGLLFQIGVFPIVMIFMASLFLDTTYHEKCMSFVFPKQNTGESDKTYSFSLNPLGYGLIAIYISFQILFPFRYALYPGNHLWTEQGYRFGWRVMLTEKSGTAQFMITDRKSGTTGYVHNSDWLTPHQEKQMSFQPDMILSYAHFLHDVYEQKGVHDPIVTVDCWVTMNGRPSARLIDPSVDLSKIEDDLGHKSWIAQYPGAIQ